MDEEELSPEPPSDADLLARRMLGDLDAWAGRQSDDALLRRYFLPAGPPDVRLRAAVGRELEARVGAPPAASLSDEALLDYARRAEDPLAARDLRDELRRRGLPPVDVRPEARVGAVLREAWRARRGAGLLVSAIYAAGLVVSTFAGCSACAVAGGGPAGAFVWFLVGQLLASYLSVGLLGLALDVARGLPVTVDDVFVAPDRAYGPGLVVWALAWLAGAAAVVAAVAAVEATPPALRPGGAVFAVGLGLPLAALAGAAGLALCLVIDRGLDPVAAGLALVERTRGHQLRLLVAGWAALGVVAGLHVAVAIVADGAGAPWILLLVLVFGEPVVAAALLLLLAQAYRALTGPLDDGLAPFRRPRPEPAPPDAPVLAKGEGAPPWMATTGLLLLLPTVATAGVGTAAIARAAAAVGLSRPEVAAAVAGATLVPLAAALILLVRAHALGRVAVVDADGVRLDPNDRWPGTRLPWDRIEGFRLVDRGVLLVVRGRPWTRLVGPVLPCRDAAVEPVVAALERGGLSGV